MGQKDHDDRIRTSTAPDAGISCIDPAGGKLADAAGHAPEGIADGAIECRDGCAG